MLLIGIALIGLGAAVIQSTKYTQAQPSDRLITPYTGPLYSRNGREIG